MTSNENGNDVNKNAQAQLDHAAAQLDDLTVARLRASRRRVLAATQARAPLRRSRWMPASIAAAIAVVAIGLVALRPGLSGQATLANADDVDWVLVKDNPDLNDNDIEFYRWLENEQDAG